MDNEDFSFDRRYSLPVFQPQPRSTPLLRLDEVSEDSGRSSASSRAFGYSGTSSGSDEGEGGGRTSAFGLAWKGTAGNGDTGLFANIMVPERPASVSEADVIDRLFTQLQVSEGKQQDADEAIFKGDLAHVLVWFKQDLQSLQKLTVVYTLASELDYQQRDSLVSMLTQRTPSPVISEKAPARPRLMSEVLSWRSVEPPPGLPASTSRPTSFKPPTSVTPPPVPPRRSIAPVAPIARARAQSMFVASGSLDSADDGLYAHIFDEGILPWLKALRLHKYSQSLGHLTREQMLNIRNEAELENLGVAAMGARHKLLRVLEGIRKIKAC